MIPTRCPRRAGRCFDWVRRPSRAEVSRDALAAPLPLAEIAPFIDWTPFFHVWELKGVYPRILEHSEWGSAARETFDAGRRLLDEIVRKDLLEARGVYGLPGGAEGARRRIFGGRRRRTKELLLFHMLRQQRPAADGPAVAFPCGLRKPARASAEDTIRSVRRDGGIGLDELVRAIGATTTTTTPCMRQGPGLSPGEAVSLELLHPAQRAASGDTKRERRSPLEDLIEGGYRRIRPAPGYPACPDHTRRDAVEPARRESQAGITLTEN